MSIFDLIRILYATHFVLGVPVALFCLRFLIFNPVVAVFTQFDISQSVAIRAVLFGGLLLLWYFVWYGSIVFALRRRFPIFSIRQFSFLLLMVYTGWIVFLSMQSKDVWTLAMANPLYPLTMVMVLLIGLTGVTILPGLKVASDAEEQAYLERTERQIDSLNQWRNDD